MYWEGILCLRAGVLSLLLCVVSGCGSGSSGTGNLRFLQASPDAPQVNLVVDGKSVATGLNYSNATGYLTVRSGTRHVQVVPSSGGAAILDTSVTIASSGNQTLILTGPAASPHTILLSDGGTTATTGDGNVRVVNASSRMGSADVYIVAAGSSIAGVSPTVANLDFNKDTGYQLVPLPAFEVFMTAPGTKNAFVDTGSVDLSTNTNQTIVGPDSASGSGFTFTPLVDQ